MKIIVANWKMNKGFDSVNEWIDGIFAEYARNYEDLKNKEIVLCAPSIFLDYIDSEASEDGLKFLEEFADKSNRSIDDFSVEEINKIMEDSRYFKLGGQDCHYEKYGSFTGDISAPMLKEVGCEFVILGHSERRTLHFETNEIVSKKISTAINHELTPIICVGESHETRLQKNHLEFIKKQILETIPNIKFKRMIIAYEPIWSIGSGIIPSIDEIEEISSFIKQLIKEKFANMFDELFVLYGGSVTSQNSKEILSINSVDGLLVGKASLDFKEFIEISKS